MASPFAEETFEPPRNAFAVVVMSTWATGPPTTPGSELPGATAMTLAVPVTAYCCDPTAMD
jgi:hypothetical protein